MEQLPLDVIMDAELVVFDGSRPVFNDVQHRFGLVRPYDIRRAARTHPATLLGFDLIGLEDLDLRRLPLLLRKAALA